MFQAPPAGAWDRIEVPKEKVREPSGMLRSLRKEKFKEVFGPFDPDELTSDPRPPPQAVVAFEELIGKPPQFKIGWHPGFKRWAFFERDMDPKLGAVKPYHCFMIISEGVREGYLPNDLDVPDKRHEHLRGIVGDFKVPDRQDMEVCLWYADGQRWSVDELDAHFAADEATVRLNRLNELRDWEYEQLDYYYLWINACANGGKQYSVPSVKLSRENAEAANWCLEERVGIYGGIVRIRRRRFGEEMEQYLAARETERQAAAAEFESARAILEDAQLETAIDRLNRRKASDAARAIALGLTVPKSFTRSM